MREALYYIIAEFKALGWHCVAYGPEFWLVVPALAGGVAIGMMVGYFRFKGGRDDDRD